MKKPTLLGALLLLVGAVALAFYGQPGDEEKWELIAPRFNDKLESRDIYIDPIELLNLMNNDGVALRIVDVRDEADWNQFHLVDAVRIPVAGLAAYREELNGLGDTGVVVLVGNDEAEATRGWQRLMVLGAPNAYVLAGGLNRWLDLFGAPDGDVFEVRAASMGDDTLHHRFASAPGGRHPASHPDLHLYAEKECECKVKLVKKVVKSGGCG